MTWKRWFTLIIPVCLIIVTVALQFEKPAVQLKELRPKRCATHFRAVEFVPETTTAWAVGFEGAVFKTTDAGLTWIKQKSDTHARLYGVQVLSEKSVWACGSSGTLIHTDDGGQTWQAITIPTSLRILDVCFQDAENGWVAGDDGVIFATVNGGQHWTKQQTNIQSGLRHIWFADNNLGYAVGYHGIVLKTIDGGQNWRAMKTPEHVSIYGADFAADGQDLSMVGSCGTILESKDFGDSFQQIPIITTNFLRDIDTTPDGHRLAVGYGIILHYELQEQKWVKGQSLPDVYLQGVSMNNKGQAIAVGRWGAILTSNNNGFSWTQNMSVFAPDMYAVAVSRTGRIVAGGANGWTLIREPEETHWSSEYCGINQTLRSAAVDSLDRIWMVGRAGSIICKDKSTPWKRIKVTSKRDMNGIFFTACSQGYIVGDQGLIMYSPDDGNNWTLQSQPTSVDLMDVCFFDRDHGFAVGEDGTILETTNGGESWLRHYTGTQDLLHSCWFDPKGHAIVIGNSISLESFSNGNNSSWHRINTNDLLTSMTPDGRYGSLLSGAILDRTTGISRSLSEDNLYDFSPLSNHQTYIGVGEFGRIVELTSAERNAQ